MNTFTAVQTAVDCFDGSPTKLAHAIGTAVLRQHVEHWLKTGRVPVEHCAAIERVTNRKVTRFQLRPMDWQQIWPEMMELPGAPAIHQDPHDRRTADRRVGDRRAEEGVS